MNKKRVKLIPCLKYQRTIKEVHVSPITNNFQIPEPPVYEPEEDETGGGMITGFNEDGELLSAGDALDSLGKKEEDPTKTKCKEVRTKNSVCRLVYANWFMLIGLC